MRVQAPEGNEYAKEPRWEQEFRELGQDLDGELSITRSCPTGSGSFGCASFFAGQFGCEFSAPFVPEEKGQDLNTVVQPWSI